MLFNSPYGTLTGNRVRRLTLQRSLALQLRMAARQLDRERACLRHPFSSSHRLPLFKRGRLFSRLQLPAKGSQNVFPAARRSRVGNDFYSSCA